jgi:MarR family transcriptional regulator, lower aerobic nicotinate degradation pathway regulator
MAHARRTPPATGSDVTSGAPANLTTMTRLVGLYRRRFLALLADEEWVARSGARPPTYGVLTVLAHEGPVSQREVCDHLGIHPSDLVDLVDVIEDQGWVERRRDPADRRRYQLTLTPAGRRILARYDELAARAEAQVLEPLTETERRRLNDLVSKVVNSHAPAPVRDRRP